MALKTTSRIVRTKSEKVKSLIARLAIMIAAKETPSLYERYAQQRAKYIAMKTMIIKRNTPKALMAARKLMSGQK